MQHTVLEELHATLLGGHLGCKCTFALALPVWWPSLPRDVAAFVLACPTCQSVKAEHGLPQGLTAPLPIMARRGCTISLDFMELQRWRSGQDFQQVNIDLMTGQVWLVPTVKTCTSKMVDANLVGSVFKDVGLLDCIVSNSNIRLVAELWTALHETLGTSLVFRTPHHHQTTSITKPAAGGPNRFDSRRSSQRPLVTAPAAGDPSTSVKQDLTAFDHGQRIAGSRSGDTTSRPP